MKTAIFSDVHGNEIALDTFLNFVYSKVEGFVCLGDTVGYGPKSNDCLEKIMNLPNLISVTGNHEEMFMKRTNLLDEIPLVQKFFEYSSRNFRHRDYLSTLPSNVSFNNFNCVHTIEGRNIYPDSTIEVGENYLIGHSHHQFTLDSNGYRVINPGSVGQNRREIDKVDFAIFDHSNASFQFFSLPYDFDSFISQLKYFDYPDDCIKYYLDKRI
jgi:predicted phosphodiesterase